GVNLAQTAAELPVPWAASLASLGVAVNEATGTRLLDAIGSRLAELLAQWEAAGGDPDAADGVLGAQLRRACATLGQEVRVNGPGGEVTGTAVDVEPGLVLRVADGGGVRRVVVTAGDVTGVRAAHAAARAAED
ncbi:biotin--protein ligase, partial [Actinomyces sp. MRS3W]|nr:biotin--protein ligase [Actinomyces sp. MRS3W]